MTTQAKQTVGVLFSLFLIVMAGIGVWYFLHTSQVEAAADAQTARKDAAKMVPVQFIVKAPSDTPDNQLIYICGSAPNMGNWQAETGLPLEKKPDGKWVGTVELMNGVNYAFKVNRGTWGTVEKGANDQEVENHDVVVEANKPVEVTVSSWADHGKSVPGRITMIPGIIVHNQFPSKYLAMKRNVVVLLPPDYESAEERRYPVLYMQDGQNLFNEATSFNGIEWKMDETAHRLMQANQVSPAIIVGVFNTELRNSEYTPPGMSTNDAKHPDSKADAYGKFLVEELKPFVDARYRTMKEREHTAIGGSAMGGLVSIYVAETHPDVFGAVAVCSPWLRSPDGQKKLLPELMNEAKFVRGTRWYIDMGTKGNGAGYPPITDPAKVSDPQVASTALADVHELTAAFDSAGLRKGQDYVYEEVQGAEFNEPAWQSRVEPLLKAIFPPGANSSSSSTN